MADEKKKEFIGPRKVTHAVAEEFKTHGGNETVTVHYEGGHTEFMPKRDYEALLTEEPTDFTILGKTKQKMILLEVLAVLAEHDFKGEEIESFAVALQNELFNSFNKATHILWTKNPNSFTPGGNAVLDRSLLEADRLIREAVPTKTDEPAA